MRSKVCCVEDDTGIPALDVRRDVEHADAGFERKVRVRR